MKTIKDLALLFVVLILSTNFSQIFAISNVENLPQITAITPSFAPAGAIIIISGKNLKTVTTIKFGEQFTTAFTIHSDDWITVVTPYKNPDTVVDILLFSPSGISLPSDRSKFHYIDEEDKIS